jgi:hypothetical protein
MDDLAGLLGLFKVLIGGKMPKTEYENNKFIVINIKHLSELEENEKFKFKVWDFKRALESLNLGLPFNKHYYVCNQDEPYAQKVIDTILEGESEKI